MTPNQERLLRFAQQYTSDGSWTHLGEDARPDAIALEELGLVEINEDQTKYRIDNEGSQQGNLVSDDGSSMPGEILQDALFVFCWLDDESMLYPEGLSTRRSVAARASSVEEAIQKVECSDEDEDLRSLIEDGSVIVLRPAKP